MDEEALGPEVELPGRREYLREDDPRFAEIATQRGYSQETARIQKVRYTHDAMIDIILADPTVKQAHLATVFGVTQPWISRIVGSDAFQAALAKRRSDITDPIIMASMEDKLRGVADQSLEILADKLQATQSADLALKTLGLATTALGFGAKDRGAPVQNNFVVNLPPKATSAEDWAASALRGAYDVDMKKALPTETSGFSTTITHDPTIQPDRMKTTEE